MDTPPYSDVARSPSGSALTAVDSAFNFSSSTLNPSLTSFGHMRTLLASSLNTLDHPNPPSLRDILAAYKHKGDGDREMLLAMLSAKTAEDQRIASQLSLRRTILELTQVESPSPHLINVHHAHPPAHDQNASPRTVHAIPDEDENDENVAYYAHQPSMHTTTHTQHVQHHNSHSTIHSRRPSQSQSQSQSQSRSPALASVTSYSPRQNSSYTQQQQSHTTEPSPRLRAMNQSLNQSHPHSHPYNTTQHQNQHRTSTSYHSSRQNGSSNGYMSSPTAPPPASISNSSAGSTPTSLSATVNGVKGRNGNAPVSSSSSASSSVGSTRVDPHDGMNNGGPRKRVKRSPSPVTASSTHPSERYTQIRGGAYERQQQQQQQLQQYSQSHSSHTNSQVRQAVPAYQGRERAQYAGQDQRQPYGARSEVYRDRDGYVRGHGLIHSQKQHVRHVSPYDHSRSRSRGTPEALGAEDELADDIDIDEIDGSGVGDEDEGERGRKESVSGRIVGRGSDEERRLEVKAKMEGVIEENGLAIGKRDREREWERERVVVVGSGKEE